MSKLETIKSYQDSPQLELVKAINELTQAAGQMDQILETFDQINETQRQSIQALADQISQQATSSLQQQLLMLSGKTDTLSNTLIKVEKAAEFLEKAQAPISKAAWKVHNAAQEIQKQPWKKLILVSVVTAMLASVLTISGTHGSRLLQQKPGTNDMQLQQLLERATPAETALLLEIYKRPNK